MGSFQEGVPDSDRGLVGEPEGGGAGGRDAGGDELAVVEVEDDTGALGGGAVEARLDRGEEGEREVAGVGGFVTAVGLDGQAPARAELAVGFVEFVAGGAVTLVLAAGDEEPGDGADGISGRSDEAAALVGDKGRDALRAEAGEVVAELAAGGKPHDEQRDGGELGVSALLAKGGEGVEQGASAAVVGLGVAEEIGEVLGGKIAGDEREVMVAGEVLPLRAVGEMAAIDIDAVEHDGDAADGPGLGVVGQPEVEGGAVEGIPGLPGDFDVEGRGTSGGRECKGERDQAEEQREGTTRQQGHVVRLQ